MPLFLKRQTVTAPLHPQFMTPAFARWLAVELVARADAAEGHEGSQGFVARWEVLAQMAEVRERLDDLTQQEEATQRRLT